LKNGRIICVQEILPINFYQLEISEQNDIRESFSEFFRIAPKTLQLKTRTEKADVNKIIQNLKEVNKEETDIFFKRELKNYINYIRDLQTNNSVCRKYYIIWEYEGNTDGERSNDLNEIYRDMYEQRIIIQNAIRSSGNLVVDPFTNNEENWVLCELLYKYFNPVSSILETFEQRYKRMAMDEAKYNQSVGNENEKNYYADDYFMPRGITLKKNYIMMDGQYQTFLCVSDKGHPGSAACGWTDLLVTGLGYDLDIFLKKLPRSFVLTALQRTNTAVDAWADMNANKTEKYEGIVKTLENRRYIMDCLKDNDEDLWECMAIITIKANSYQNLIFLKNLLKKNLESRSIYTVDSFQVAPRLFKMVMPFMNFDNSLFNKYKRNYLTSSLGTLYNYTSHEMLDEKGVVIGTTSNGSLVSLDNFNTQIFSNANIMLLGTSGSGKTFTELMLSRRMRLSGMRTYFILPVKGMEYKAAVENIGGEYIPLHPGSKACLNLLQIRPEVKIDKSSLEEDVKYDNASLLTKKINTIIIFLQLIMGENISAKEADKLNGIISEMYGRFGITTDNKSIYRRGTKIVKEMPIIQDLHDTLMERRDTEKYAEALSPFIAGNCQNFNGQTNINLTNRCIAFDVDEDIVGEHFLPAFMYIAFETLYDLVKQDNMQKDVIFLDEAWKMMQNDACAIQVQRLAKLIRGFAGSVVIATQDIRDFIDQKSGFGKAILSNTKIKILLGLEKDEVRKVAEVIDLNKNDVKIIKKFSKGTGMLISNDNKTVINFEATESEIAEFTTDVNVRASLAKKKTKV